MPVSPTGNLRAPLPLGSLLGGGEPARLGGRARWRGGEVRSHGHRRAQPSPPEGRGRPRCSLRRRGAEAWRQRHPSEQPFRAAAEMRWAERGDGVAHGAYGPAGRQHPRAWRHPTPSARVRPLGATSCRGGSAFALLGGVKGLPPGGRPSSRTVHVGRKLCLKQQPRLAKQRSNP